VPVNSQGIFRLAKLRFAPQILSQPARRQADETAHPARAARLHPLVSHRQRSSLICHAERQNLSQPKGTGTASFNLAARNIIFSSDWRLIRE
jgi:hypothetical protein